MRLRKVAVALVLISTAAFVLGVALERASSSEATPSGEVTHQKGGEETHSDEAAIPQESTTSPEHAEEGKIFGVNPEATSLVVVVVLGSLALAFGIWFRPDWRWILLITASGMAVFTLFDIREAAHQFSE
jgi:hypothetical protein